VLEVPAVFGHDTIYISERSKLGRIYQQPLRENRDGGRDIQSAARLPEFCQQRASRDFKPGSRLLNPRQQDQNPVQQKSPLNSRTKSP